MDKAKGLRGTLLAALVIGGGLLVLLVAFSLPSRAMARYLCRIAEGRYGIRCALQQIRLRFDPRSIGAVHLHGLTIFEPGSQEVLVQAKEIRVLPRLSLGGGEGWIGVQGIEVVEPVLHLRRTKGGRWNLQGLLAAPAAGRPAFPLPPQLAIHQGTLRMDGTAFPGIDLSVEADPSGRARLSGQRGSLHAILELDGHRWPSVEGHALLVDRGWRVRGSGEVHPSGAEGYRYRFLFREGEAHLPDLRLTLTAGEIHGALAIRGGGWRHQGVASLTGRVRSGGLGGEETVAVEAAWSGDGGDLRVTRFQIRGPSIGTVKMTAGLKTWGQQGIHFRSEELHLPPALMARLLSRLTPGTQIEEISRPQLRGTLVGFQGPLELTLLVEQLKIGVAGYPLLLRGGEGMVRGEGGRWGGTARIRTLSTPPGDLRDVEVEFLSRGGTLEIRRMGLELLAHPPLRVSGDGTVRWKGGTTTLEIQGEVHRSLPLRRGRLELRGTLKRSPHQGWDTTGRLSTDAAALLELVRWYRETPLWASRGRLTADWKGVIGVGAATTLSGRLHLEEVDLGSSPPGDSSHPLLTGVKGTIPFRLDGGRWLIPRSTVEWQAGLSLSLQGGWDRDQGLRIDVDLPRTPVVRLTPSLRAFSSSEVQGGGAVEARGGWVGGDLTGEIHFDQVHLTAGGLSLTGLHGRLPLGPETRSLPPLQTGWPALTVEVHRHARQEMERQPPRPQTLTMKALGYQRLALHDMILHLIPGDRRIAIDPLVFEVYGGRGWGRGELDFTQGTMHLILLFDGLSLTELLDQFPPLRGYLSGRVDGLAEFAIPLADPAKARGQGRWWVVQSPKEERIISQEMIERLGGPPARFFQILTGRNRAYDVGVLTAVLDQGYLIFPELEISHRTLGMKDLEIRVVPPFNRIALDHLVSAIFEAMERMGGSPRP